MTNSPSMENIVPEQAKVAPESTQAPTQAASSALPLLIRLPAGIALNEIEAQEMAAAHATRIIVLAGSVDCGKTTLLTSLYELYQSGPIKVYRFAGCETLPAFEQRCHLSRTDSENDRADTSRTVYSPEPEYLHIRVDDMTDGFNHIDFLFTDVSGEMYEHARDSTTECEQLTFLKRASHFLLFLDGEKAVQPDKRWAMFQDAKSLLRSCLDSNMLDRECFITVVWSKCDYFEVAANKEPLADFVKTVEAEITSVLANRISNYKFHKVAARPTQFPALEMGYGLKELLVDWVDNWPQGKRMNLEPPANNGGQRESELFAKRHNAGNVNT